MGTRGTIGIVIDGEVKNTYNHFDSYPSGVGVDVLADAREISEAREHARDLARNLKLVDETLAPSDEESANLKQFTDDRVSTGSDWYAVLRNLQGKLLETLQVGYMIDSKHFPENSLWCEWGYLIDLDAETFQVYRGFQKERHQDGIWAGLPTDEDFQAEAADLKRRLDAGKLNQQQYNYFSNEKQRYHSIRLVAEWPLDRLPSDEEFLEAAELSVATLESIEAQIKDGD